MQKVYLLLGKEQGLKDEYLEKLLSSFKKKYNDLNISKIFLSEISLIELSDILFSNSLFVKNEVFIIYEAELIKNKKDIGFIGDILNKINNKSVIFISDANSIVFDLKGKVDFVKKVFYELSETDRFSFVKKKFFELGFKITDEAISLMILMLDSDTRILKSYINSFFGFVKNKNINENDIKSWLTFIRSENTFSLFEFILKKDIKTCLIKAGSIIKQGDKDLTSVISNLIWQFKRLLKIQIESKKMNLQEVFQINRIFFSFKKTYELGIKNYSIYNIKKALKILYKFDLYSRIYPKSIHFDLSCFLIFCIINQSKVIIKDFYPKIIYNF